MILDYERVKFFPNQSLQNSQEDFVTKHIWSAVVLAMFAFLQKEQNKPIITKSWQFLIFFIYFLAQQHG